MLGRTNVPLPVCNSRLAAPCWGLEQCIERMTHSSSATVARWGRKSLIQIAALTALAELRERSEQVAETVGVGQDAGQLKRQRLAVVAHQKRLVIEQVVMGRPAIHEQHDHALGRAREMGRPGRQGIGRLGRRDASSASSPASATLAKPAPICRNSAAARQRGSGRHATAHHGRSSSGPPLPRLGVRV